VSVNVEPGPRVLFTVTSPPMPRVLAAAIKARWSCKQAHQQLNEELGLDHFEGRTWRGLHHHALLTLISFAFLQHLRLDASRRREKKNVNPRGQSTAAVTAGNPPCAPRPRTPRSAALPALQWAADISAARIDLAK
jgi:hypothetical protein